MEENDREPGHCHPYPFRIMHLIELYVHISFFSPAPPILPNVMFSL